MLTGIVIQNAIAANICGLYRGRFTLGLCGPHSHLPLLPCLHRYVYKLYYNHNIIFHQHVYHAWAILKALSHDIRTIFSTSRARAAPTTPH